MWLDIMKIKRDEYWEGLCELDNFAVLTEPSDETDFPYDLHKLDAYCKKKGIDPSQLTNEELKQFEIKRPE